MSAERERLYADAHRAFDVIEIALGGPTIDRDLLAVYVATAGDAVESLQDADTPSLADYPALQRWRDWTLQHPARQSPLAMAAAWEMAALEHELNGDADRAEQARENAHAQRARAA